MAAHSLIEPSSFDLIVLGTGLPQSIIAAAAASCGRSVLHLDPCDFYGSHWASLPLDEFSRWAASSGALPIPSSSLHEATSGGSNLHTDHAAGGRKTEENAGPGQSHIEVENDNSVKDAKGSSTDESRQLEMEISGLEALPVQADSSMYSDFCFVGKLREDSWSSRSYNIDLAGPKLAFCGGPLVDLLLRSGASNYLEFRSLEANFLWTSGGLLPVPSSREDVFTNQTLSLVEKRYLMRFFKLVIKYASSEGESELKDMELDSPFVEFLHRQQLPASVQATILYAIALANDNQEQGPNVHGHIISTREGLSSLSLYLSSVKRFQNATGAFLYPLYGQSELPQAFSRSAAVKGALYVLRMSVDALLRDKESQTFKGIRTSSGQLILAHKLVTGPSLYATLCDSFASEEHASFPEACAHGGSMHPGRNHKVVRSICITDKSLLPDLSIVMVNFPPQSVTTESNGVIRVLQLGSGSSVCPEGQFLVQLSMGCSDGSVGINALRSATQLLFNFSGLNGDMEGDNEVWPTCSKNIADSKPNLLWAVYFTQDTAFPDGTKWVSKGNVGVCNMPDTMLDYRSMVASIQQLFEGLFPGVPFFPRMEETGVDAEEENATTRGQNTKLADDVAHETESGDPADNLADSNYV